MFKTHIPPHRGLLHGAIAALTVLSVAGCSAEADLPQPGQPAPPEPASVTVPTSTAAPGTSIAVRASGFTPRGTVEIGIGQPRSEYTVVTEVSADAQGRVDANVQVPDWTTRGESYVVVVTEPDNTPSVTSEPFVVGAAGDAIRVHGEVTDEGVECPALRGPFGTLYTLAVSDFDHAPGTELMVEGTIAGASTCMQGTTIDVRTIEHH